MALLLLRPSPASGQPSTFLLQIYAASMTRQNSLMSKHAFAVHVFDDEPQKLPH
jgi:hypothetical protein